MEDSTRAFDDFGANHVLIGLSVAICFSIALFNGFGVSVTKNASAAQRSTIDTSRTVIIWIFFLIVAFDGKREEFKTLQLFGFIFLVFGTLVFNEILILPFLLEKKRGFWIQLTKTRLLDMSAFLLRQRTTLPSIEEDITKMRANEKTIYLKNVPITNSYLISLSHENHQTRI